MNDKDWIRSVKQITDPLEMLKCIFDYEDYFGFDPYYAELRNTMINQAEKIIKENETPIQNLRPDRTE